MLSFRFHGRKNLLDEKGQTLVEFALILPVFLLLVLGVIQFAMYLSGQVTVAHASREGVRMAAVGAGQADVQSRVESIFSPTPFFTLGPVSLEETDDEVTVSVEGTVISFLPFLSGILEGPLTLSSSAVMQVESEEIFTSPGSDPIDIDPEVTLFDLEVNVFDHANRINVQVDVTPPDVPNITANISLYYSSEQIIWNEDVYDKWELVGTSDGGDLDIRLSNLEFRYPKLAKDAPAPKGYYKVIIHDDFGSTNPWSVNTTQLENINEQPPYAFL